MYRHQAVILLINIFVSIESITDKMVVVTNDDLLNSFLKFKLEDLNSD